MSVFVDTNILVYAHDTAAGERHERARRLVEQLWAQSGRPAISMQVIQELYVSLRKKGLAPADAARVASDYFGWSVVVNDGALLRAAMSAADRWTISLWDALIVEAARAAGAAELWSEDLSDGQDFDGVRVVNVLRHAAP